jgi:signal transduction histidine kinase
MLLGPVGGYLIHPDSKLLFKKTIFSATDSIEHPDVIQLGREMTAGHQGMMHVTLNNVLCHVCYTPLSDTGWSIALVCHDDDVLRDYRHLLIVMIVIVIIGMVLILWITRRVVQRNIGHLNELMEATKKLAEGNYDTLIPSSKHKDAVGKLQNAFRKMQMAIISHLETIKENDKEIQIESEELEHTLPIAQETAKRRQQFIQNVSRQISTPINIIEGLVRVMHAHIVDRCNNKSAQQSLQNDETRNITKTMKHNASHLNRITLMLYDSSDTGIADTSRYLKNDIVSCNEVAKECVNHTLRLYPVQDIHFETELSDSFCVKSNHLYLMRTIRELLHNAVKFSDGQHIALRVMQTETAVRFIVEDVGPGLPKDSEDLIFVPFTKVDNLSEGLGLGLPLCKSHMVGLGGDLFYDADYQQGCRFIIEVPKE